MPWAKAPAWARESAIKGVEFHLANPEASEAASHESWLKQKEADGWTFGLVKDAEKKQHPCYVPFTALPAEQQVKDALFKATVAATRRLVEDPQPAVPAEYDVLAAPEWKLAGDLYETYCTAVGGVAFNGDKLPSWHDFSGDFSKTKQATAWMTVALRVLRQPPQTPTATP